MKSVLLPVLVGSIAVGGVGIWFALSPASERSLGERDPTRREPAEARTDTRTDVAQQAAARQRVAKGRAETFAAARTNLQATLQELESNGDLVQAAIVKRKLAEFAQEQQRLRTRTPEDSSK